MLILKYLNVPDITQVWATTVTHNEIKLIDGRIKPRFSDMPFGTKVKSNSV